MDGTYKNFWISSIKELFRLKNSNFQVNDSKLKSFLYFFHISA